MKRLFLGPAMALSAGAASANPVVNANITTENVDVAYYSEVTILGPGGGVVNFLSGDGLLFGDQTAAFEAALSALSLPSATELISITETPLAAFEEIEQFLDANGAIFNVDYIGDPDDYTTWIAIGQEDVNVDILQRTTTYMPYALEASIVSAVPLPAGLPLLGSAAFALLLLRRRRAAA